MVDHGNGEKLRLGEKISFDRHFSIYPLTKGLVGRVGFMGVAGKICPSSGRSRKRREIKLCRRFFESPH